MSLKRMINGQVIDIAGSGGGGPLPEGVITSETLTDGKIWTGTLAEYNAITDKDADTLYCITNDSTETLDNVPTQGSSNGVTSGGVYAYTNSKANISALGDTDISLPAAGQILSYNATLQKWVNSEAPASSKIIQPFTFDVNGYEGQSLTITKDGTSLTPITLDDTGDLTLFLDATGTYTYSVTATYGFVFSTTVTYRYKRQYDSIDIYGKAPMYPWETATIEQISDMLRSYYGGAYDAADIATLKSSYFTLGAKRTIHLSHMDAGDGCSESHFDSSGADYQFTIIGTEHDDLVTQSSEGKTKALLTIQQDRILYKNTTDSTYSSNYPSTADGGGQMNSSNTTTGGWSLCPRRTWCNNTYYYALPSDIRGLIKAVSKVYADSSAVTGTTQDNVFLLSENEVFGAKTYASALEGTQYQYFTTASNICKKPSYTTYSSAYWWERSVYNATQFCGVGENGAASYYSASNAFGLAPAFCL